MFRRGVGASGQQGFRSAFAIAWAVAYLAACTAYDRARYESFLDGTAVDVSRPDGADAASDALDARDASVNDGADVEPDRAIGTDAQEDVRPDAGDSGSSCTATSCGPDHACCGGVCVDTASDGANCGACGNSCSHTVCSAGTCTNVCAFGFENCNNNIIDGCEAALATDANNCGGCGTRCSSANASGSCVAGACRIDSCNAGFADCDGVASNGCETDTRTSLAHCGVCGNVCPTAPNTTASCTTGICATRCNAGFDDCNGTASDGCETSIASPTNCGTCGTVCPSASPVCSASGTTFACASGCATGQTRCGMSCVRLTDDVNNCGTCGHACTAPTGGTATCVNSACSGSCPAGSTLCGSACLTTATDPLHCGSCTNACPAPANGVATCASGSCGVTCNAGCTMSGTTCTCVVAAPRPIAPLSTSIVTTQSPTLRWSLAAGSDGAAITLCRNRQLTMACQSIVASGSSATPASPLARGVWYWQLRGRSGGTTGTLTSPVWQFTAPARSSMRDGSWGSAFDANGDGFGDFLVGAPTAPGTGAARVYTGAAMMSGSMSSPLTGTSTASGFGSVVASAGDFNGDGFAEALVGAPTGAMGGWVTLFRGGASGLATGYSSGLSSATGMGTSVSTAGDIDHDGYADVVVGSPTDLTNRGVVWIAFGDPSSSFAPRPRLSINGPDTAGNFGAVVASGGDINCDGHPDLVVSAPNAVGGEGRVYVFYGDGTSFATTAGTVLTGSVADGHFGASLAIIGDVNADGCMDIAVGRRPGTMGTPANVFVFLGGSAGLVSPPARTLSEPSSGAQYGYALGSGDVNADGYNDLYVGAPGLASVYVYAGGATGIPTTNAFAVVAGPPTFGSALATAANVNGDSFDDLISGAPGTITQRGAVVIAVSNGTLFGAPLAISDTDTGTSFGAAVALLLRADRIWRL